MDADDLLRETFAEYADRAPRAERLAADVRRRAARSRRQGWAVVGAAAAGVVALAVAAAAFVPGHLTRRPVAGPYQPPYTQRVYGHGIEAYVPAEWPVDAQSCGVPRRDTVLTHGDALWCYGIEPPSLTVAYLESDDAWDSATRSMIVLRTRDSVLSGHAARFVTARTKPLRDEPVRDVSAVVVPDLGAAFWVVSPYADAAAGIAATARVVDADWQGCAQSIEHLYATEAPARPDARTEMVPTGAVAARACNYDAAGAIYSWHAMTPAEISDARRVLNTLPHGFGDPPPRENKRCENDVLSPLVVTFQYASGPDVVVYVHLFGCEQLGATNGAVQGGYDGALIRQVTRLGGSANGVMTAWSYIPPTS
jgi:hypothetical protein